MPLRQGTRERNAPNRLEVRTGKKTYRDVVKMVRVVKAGEGEKASNPTLGLYKSTPSRFKSDHRGETCKGTLDTSTHLST